MVRGLRTDCLAAAGADGSYPPQARSLAMARLSMLPALGMLVAAALSVGPASAETFYRNCHWDGSGPICEGRCAPERDEVARRSTTQGCLTGRKLYCCQKMGSISQPQGGRECTPARYGTPGCPYPSFGSARRVCPPGTRGYWPRCRRIAGATCGSGMTGTPPNCYPILH